ncbi:MAG: hypothetical protein BWX47_02008 [candidate division Hyd24-12 bacterium ADurb.Bin004]|nr:MAG: hypothetical protein BWX47_02008 [candidate division Hyd24-12 bacterium ADurb.Bin004]
MTTGTPASPAISAARGCTTPAPCQDICLRSSALILSIRMAEGIMEGSADLIASTFLKSTASQAPRAAARARAVVSDPPLPRVVAAPSGPAPWKPATTGMRPTSTRALILEVSMLLISASPETPSVAIPASQPVSDSASRPTRRSSPAMAEAAMISPAQRSLSRSAGRAPGAMS